MNNENLLRIGKIALGAVGMISLLGLAITGNLGLSTYSFVTRHPARNVLLFIVIFSFPYLMMSSIINQQEESESLESGGLMKAYAAQNNSVKRFRIQMISIVFGVVMTLVIFAISNQTALKPWEQ